MYCIGCGEPLGVTSGKCPSCRTAIVGARFLEAIPLQYGTRVVVPPVCCCCLAPRQETKDEELATILLSGDKRYTKVPIPWCSGCRRRRRAYERLASIGWVATGIALYFVFEPFAGDVAYLIALFGGFAGYVGAPPLLAHVLPNMRLPGHVPACDGVHGSAGKRTAEILLGNRAFARIWRDLNAGIPSRAPALAWAERDLTKAGEPVRRDPPPNTVVEARARVREQLASGGGPVRPRRIGFGTRPVGADAAFEILRFTVKRLEIAEDGLRATDERGAAREASWSDIVHLAARRTPEGPPFSGTIFVDVVTRSREPLRIVPTTRANYGVLPGAGATSHENFRRLAAYLKDRCPGLEIEAESRPYLEQGRGFPPALETTESLVDYDSRHAAPSAPGG